MKRIINIIVILISISSYVLGQLNCIAIKDSITLQPLTGVLCILQDDFIYTTDDNGKFCHEFREDVVNLEISIYQLGRSPIYRKINIKDSIILLSSSAVLLDEVIINSRPDIIAKNDTTVFNMKYFRDSLEVNIEDLLQKLPGFQVDAETGVISVNGFNINTIMVDGNNLVGSQYQKISRRFSADIIDKIEVFDDGENSNKKRSINLIINENNKNKKLIGSFVSSINSNLRLGTEFTGLITTKSIKNIMSLSFNNNGNSSFYASNAFGSEELSSSILIREEPSIWLNSFDVPFLIIPKTNYLRNSEWVMSNDGVINFTKSTLRYNFQFYKDTTNFENQSTYNYFEPPSIFKTIQNKSNERTIINNYLTYEKKLAANSKIIITNESIFSKGINNIYDKALEPLYEQKIIINNGINKARLEFIKNFTKAINLKFTTRFNYQSLNQIYSNQFRDSLEFKDTFIKEINHDNRSDVVRLENTLEVIRIHPKNTQFNLGIGFLHLNWKNNFQNNLNIPPIEKFKMNNLIANLTFLKNLKNNTFAINSISLVSNRNIYYLMNLNQNHRFGKSAVNSNLTMSKSLPLNQLYAGQNVFQDFNQLFIYDFRPQYQQFWKLDSRYIYENYEGDILLGCSFYANMNKDPITQDLRLLNDFIVSNTIFERSNKALNLSFSANIEYYIQSINTRFKLHPKLGIRNYNMLIEGKETINSFNERGVKMSIKNNVISNLQIYVEWNHSYLNINQNNNNLNQIILNDFKLSATFKAKNFAFKLNGNYFKYYSLQESLFLDANLTFKPEKKKYSIVANLLNLLDYKSLNYFFQGDFSTSNLNYPLFGRLINVKFFHTI